MSKLLLMAAALAAAIWVVAGQGGPGVRSGFSSSGKGGSGFTRMGSTAAGTVGSGAVSAATRALGN